MKSMTAMASWMTSGFAPQASEKRSRSRAAAIADATCDLLSAATSPHGTESTTRSMARVSRPTPCSGSACTMPRAAATASAPNCDNSQPARVPALAGEGSAIAGAERCGYATLSRARARRKAGEQPETASAPPRVTCRHDPASGEFLLQQRRPAELCQNRRHIRSPTPPSRRPAATGPHGRGPDARQPCGRSGAPMQAWVFRALVAIALRRAGARGRAVPAWVLAPGWALSPPSLPRTSLRPRLRRRSLR